MRLLILYLIWKALGKESKLQEFPLVYTLFKWKLLDGSFMLVYEIDKKKDEEIDEVKQKKLLY